MSVAELAERCGRSLSQIVDFAFGTGVAPTSAAAPIRRGRPPGSKAKAQAKPKAKAKAKPGTAPASKAEAPAASKAVAPNTVASRSKAAASKRAGAATKRTAEVDTRAAAGRAKYEETVLGAIRTSKGRVKAEELRKRLGGTPLQIRAALHKLIEDGKIKAQGQARGMTYAPA